MIQCWLNVELPGLTIHGGGEALAYVAQTNGFGVAFSANWTNEIPIEGVASGGNATSWAIELTNTTTTDAPCNMWVHWTPAPLLATSGMPWRISSASTPAGCERNIYRNGTGNVGLRIEHDGASATWIRDSLAGVIIPAMSSVRITGSVANCEPEDLDGTGSVNAADLGILLGQFGSPGTADFDASGAVGPEDLAVMLAKLNGGNS